MSLPYIFCVDEIRESSECPDDRKMPTVQTSLTRSLIRERRMRWCISGVALSVAGASSVVMNAYHDAAKARQHDAEGHHIKEAHSFVPQQLLQNMFTRSRSSQQSELPDFLHDPSPIHLVVACLSFSIATNCFYHLHKGDRHQLEIIVCGALNALAVGWVLKEDVQSLLTGLGPWFIIASLALSAALHKVL